MGAWVNEAVVVDVEADLLPHGNGSKFIRLVLRHNVARELWSELHEYVVECREER